MKPLVVDIPYPSLKNITEDKRSAYVISPAYSGLNGELNAILSYEYHSQFFNKLNMPEFKETVQRIAVAEMEHLEILGELLIKLGANPVYTLRAFDKYDFYNTSNVSESNVPEKMILDEIAAEINTVNDYCEMEKVLPENVSAVIKRIKLDEELHIKALKELMEKLNTNVIL